MRKRFNIYSALWLLLVMVIVSSCHRDEVPSTKRERNAIKQGNEQYDKQRYADAEVAYKRALSENPNNMTAQFNLASAYIKQRGNDIANKQDSLIRTADAMLANINASAGASAELSHGASYDRGNLAYKAENYDAAIAHYKQSLRINPDNYQARQNLRLAQLKKQEQQQNQDQNQQNQDQQQDQQNQQDQQQNQDQNQDQNKNQEKDQDQDKEQNQQNSPNQQDQQNKEQRQQQGGLSEASAQQILKAMEDKENGTRRKVELMKQGEEKRANRRNPEKPW